jgi:hypothetical protein
MTIKSSARGCEAIEYFGKSRANLDRVRIRETLGVGKFCAVVKDDRAIADPWPRAPISLDTWPAPIRKRVGDGLMDSIT